MRLPSFPTDEWLNKAIVHILNNCLQQPNINFMLRPISFTYMTIYEFKELFCQVAWYFDFNGQHF